MPLTVFGDRPAKYRTNAERKNPKARTLLVKFLSHNETRAWSKKARAATSGYKADEERDAEYLSVLGEVVVGWENIPGDFDLAKIFDHFTTVEVVTMFEDIPLAMVLDADDLKN